MRYVVVTHGTVEMPLHAALRAVQHLDDLDPEQGRVIVAAVRRATWRGLDTLRALSADDTPAGEEARAAIAWLREEALR